MNFSWKKEHTLHSLYISASFSNITPLGRCFGNNLLNRINNSRSNSSSSRFQNNGNKKRTEQQHKMEYNYYVRIKFRVIAFCFVFTWHDMHSWHYGIHFKFWFVFFSLFLSFGSLSRQCTVHFHHSAHFSNCVSPMREHRSHEWKSTVFCVFGHLASPADSKPKLAIDALHRVLVSRQFRCASHSSYLYI